MKLKNNSKKIKKNDIYISTVENQQLKEKYIKDATKKKASLIITNKQVNLTLPCPILKVDNELSSYYQILNDYYQNPFKNLTLIGITGTDGKTSVATIIKNLLDEFDKCANIGTNGLNPKHPKINSKNTTTTLEETIKYAKYIKDLNYKYLVMECSSEGLKQNRCYNLPYKIAILTNITKEHLNAHNSLEEYKNCKKILFNYLDENSIKILNTDTDYFDEFKNISNAKLLTYGTNPNAIFSFEDVKTTYENTTFILKYQDKKYFINSPLLGTFNVYNLVCSIACLISLGFDINDIISKIKTLKPIKGRINIIETKKFKIILDYAHTTYATKQILDYVKSICLGNLYCIVGCAGNRYKEKRQEIGKLVSDYSKIAIFTKDDPRNEKLSIIFKDMSKDLTKNNVIYIKNRKKAIKKAIKLAKKNDIILILGKGLDNYMAYKNKYKKYSDLKVIEKTLKIKNLSKKLSK